MSIGNVATTGMQAAMSNMEVISNNIANASTPGYKSSYINFADIFPSGNNASQVQAGLGVSVTSIQQNFTQGGPVATGIKSDLSINNNGFFIMRDVASGQDSYSRYGHFNFLNGYLMVGNERLQGFPAVNNTIPAGGTPTDIYIDNSPLPAKTSTLVKQAQLNLNANEATPTGTPFSPTDQSTYNFTSTAVLYDSLGNQNQLSLYYIKDSANNWSVNAYVNGASVGTGSLTFSTNGALSSSTGLSSLSFNPSSGAASPQSFAVSMTGATQVASSSVANPFTSDGYAAGTYSGYSIDQNGLVTIDYDNKQHNVAGQIALATFLSPEGLQNNGNMSWLATTSSGTPTINQATSQNGILQSCLEMSNVNLTNEMVNLIAAQNIFQANAQVQQTYNQVMQVVTKL